MPSSLHGDVGCEVTPGPVSVQGGWAVLHDICSQVLAFEYLFELAGCLHALLHVADLGLAIFQQSFVPLESILPERKVTSCHVRVGESLTPPW